MRDSASVGIARILIGGQLISSSDRSNVGVGESEFNVTDRGYYSVLKWYKERLGFGARRRRGADSVVSNDGLTCPVIEQEFDFFS